MQVNWSSRILLDDRLAKPSMMIESIDHVALPIRNVDEMLQFYESLGFQIESSLKPKLYSANLQNQKINFHSPSLWEDNHFGLRAKNAMPGCGDLCFVWSGSIDSLFAHLKKIASPIEEGPVSRQGGRSNGNDIGASVYTRDPDANLIEFICYPKLS